MKQVFFLLIALWMYACPAVGGEHVKLVPSASDTTRMDTVIVHDSPATGADSGWQHSRQPRQDDLGVPVNLVVLSLLMCFGLPLFVVAIALWFRYRNRQAKYRLMAEALAAGREIPADLADRAANRRSDLLAKGITELFTGIGIGVFFWLVTGSKKIAAVGILIFCIGLAHVVIAYVAIPGKQQPGDGKQQ